MQEAIGFIGLGAMGGRMAANLLRAGYSLTVFDLNPTAVEGAKALGAVAAPNAAAAARNSAVVLLSLPNAAIVEDTVLGPGGVLEGAAAGTLLVDFSSITPHAIRKIAKKAAEKGVRVLDAPVSGGTSGAEKGTLNIMVGGGAEDFSRALPLLEHLGKKIEHVGEVGAGDTVKLINNLLLGINMAAVAEALALGVKAGISPRTLYEVIRGSSGASYALTAKYESFIARGQFAPGFQIDLQHKDLQLAVDTARETGMPLPLGTLAQQIYQIARAQGLGGEDISALVKLGEGWGDILVREEE